MIHAPIFEKHSVVLDRVFSVGLYGVFSVVLNVVVDVVVDVCSCCVRWCVQ